MDKYVIYIDNYNITHFDRLLNSSFISSTKPNLKLNSKIVTFDIETYIKDNKFIPFSCGWFDGELMRTYYLTDFKSPYEMLLEALREMLDFNPNAKVYIHNFANFDYMFLIKVLFENFKVKPYFKDNKVISLVYQHKENDKTKIFLFDSYLILPSSLKTLAAKYKVEDQKGYFPYSMVNENNLNYIGPTPDISLFNGITNEEFEGIMSYTWNLKNELIRYLELDLKSLHQVLTRFSKDIFNLEKIDITKLPTISSISFKVFRTNYLENSKLPIVKGNAHKDMRNAYYGGVVEVFKNEGTNLKYYDVTSLYPFAMLNDMPTGEMLFTTDQNINNYFGIVFVEVDTTGLDPKYLDYPLLPHKLDGRMYNPLGKWTGWYFSEEIKLAISFGYSVKVFYGYKFDKTSNVFTKFINKYFEIKAGLSNISMNKTTAKMVLNSMYGRLGMKPYLDNIDIVGSKKADEILSKFNVKEQYSLTNELEFIRYENKPITGFLELYDKDEYLNFMLDCDSKNISTNQSLPSAIAVTAYARIEMIQYKLLLSKLGIKLYYTDTDSIITDRVLPQEFIGDDLGLMKDELKGGIIKKAYFLGIKKYGYLDDNNFTHSIFSGIERNSLTWNEIEQIANGVSLIKHSPTRFYKNLNNLNIIIKESLETTITFNTRKTLLNNKYLPIKININFLITLDYYLILIKKRIINILKKFNIIKF